MTSSPSTAFHNGWRSRFNAWFFLLFDRYIAFVSQRHKWVAFGDLQPGVIVEIGPGVGANFDYVPAGSRVVAIEPNLAMHDALRERAEVRGVSLQIRSALARRTHLDDASVDDVLCSLVLCTVEDPDAVLSEIRRILKPGGRFRFFEHVAAPWWSPRRWLQHLVRRPWGWVFEGCDTCRHTATAIERAGFVDVSIRRSGLPGSVFLPVNDAISGTAVR